MAEGSALVLETAKAAATAGICVLPAARDGSKRPGVPSWGQFQERRPTPDELAAWFYAQQQEGLGFVCGRVSGGLEMLEFEDMDTYLAFLELAQESGLAGLVVRVRSGYEEATPGGGVHLLYRCPEAPRGNTKLAQRPCPGEPECGKHVAGKEHALVETRGDGGWVVVAPSAGATHPTGGAYVLMQGGIATIETLTPDEREDLWRLARALDEMPVREEAPPPPRDHQEPDGSRPGDLFNAQATWDDVLAPHGWRRLSTRGGLTYWRRPGKDRGVSATTGVRAAGDPSSDLLWVFSTSTPFEPEQGYSRYRAYAVLNHAGDWAAAARDLRSQGYRGQAFEVGPLVAPAQPVQNVHTLESGATTEESSLVALDDPQPPRRKAAYCFRPIFPPDHFVGQWIAHCSKRVDAAYEYHEGVALVALAAASAGVRARLSVWPRGLQTNLWVLLVGDTTISRKSTSISFGEMLLQEAVPGAKLPDQTSQEAFVQELSKRSHRPSVWVAPEFGQQLESMERKGSMTGYKPVMLDLYDGKDYEYRRHDKRVKGQTETVEDVDWIRAPHFSLIGGTTDDILQSLSPRDVASGLLPRFGVVWPESKPPYMDISESAPAWDDEWKALVARLRAIQAFAGHGRVVNVIWTPEAMRDLNAYGRELADGLHHRITTRLPAMAFKLAMLAALGELTEKPATTDLVIEPRDAERGLMVARRWQESAERFGVGVGGLDVIEMKYDQRAQRVKDFLLRRGGSAPQGDVLKASKMLAEDLAKLGDTMQQRGDVTIVRNDGTGGRPSFTWTLRGK